jgi:DNA polymerase III subunit delta
MQMNYPALIKRLDTGQLGSIYFFYGSEDLLVERALEKVKTIALSSGSADFNLSIFRAGDGDTDWTAFADALISLPLIPTHRVVILKDLARAIRSKNVQKLIERAVDHPENDLTLIMIELDSDFVKKSFGEKLLKNSENVTSVVFNPLTHEELEKELIQFAATFSKKLNQEALERILAETDPSLRDLLSKLEVLIFFIGDKDTIDSSDLEASLVFTREIEIFSLMQAIGKRDVTQTRRVLQYILRSKEELGTLLHLLYRQIWALYRMKYLQEQKVPNSNWQAYLNLRPAFLDRRYREYLPNYSRAELGRSLEKLTQIDLARKTQSPPDDLLLTTLTESLLNP